MKKTKHPLHKITMKAWMWTFVKRPGPDESTDINGNKC